MKIKFNHFERVAGLFVLTALVGCIGAAMAVAIKKGWFATKVPFETIMPSAPKGNVDITGQRFLWTSNIGTGRLEAFIVKVP